MRRRKVESLIVEESRLEEEMRRESSIRILRDEARMKEPEALRKEIEAV